MPATVAKLIADDRDGANTTDDEGLVATLHLVVADHDIIGTIAGHGGISGKAECFESPGPITDHVTFDQDIALRIAQDIVRRQQQRYREATTR